MMQMPLNLEWIDGISIWLAVTSLILLLTSEIISSYYGKTTVLIKRKRLRRIALIVGVAFMLTIFIQLYTMSIN